MVDAGEINRRIITRVGRVLDYAELAVPNDKINLFRKLVLDEFGHSGLRSELAGLLDHGDQSGKDGQGKGPVTGRKGGAP